MNLILVHLFCCFIWLHRSNLIWFGVWFQRLSLFPSSLLLWNALSIKGQLLSKLSSIKCCLPAKLVFNQRLFIKGFFPSKVVFRQRSSLNKGHLPSKVIFYHRSSSIKGCLPSKVVLYQRVPSIKIFFHERLSSIQLNWAQAELGKNNNFWESSLWLAIWETSWWKFR